MNKLKFFILTIALIMFAELSNAAPVLDFSDIISGPDTGIGDSLGSGAIVTIWGQNLGSSQGASTVSFTDSAAVSRQCYVYYWQNASGNLPGGPADLYTSHRMQEICVSIPDSALGAGTISVTVGGVVSNTVAFTVRAGDIYHIKSTGNNANAGSFANPWLTLRTLSGAYAVGPGDIVYSHGIGATASVYIGDNTGIPGTPESPVAVLTYPNTRCSVSASDRPLFYNYAGGNAYFVFSKWALTDSYGQSFSLFEGSRVIGNYVTGPTITGGVAGFIGGNCTGLNPDMCGGHRILGNEVEVYGANGNVDTLQHLVYISNRSGFQSTNGYEIGWNNFHDNPIYQGIHVYDQSGCGGWATPIKIHHNFVKNNGGNQININLDCAEDTTEFQIYNNVTYIEPDYTTTGNSIPAAALRIEAEASNTFKIYNNTFYGWTAAAALGTGVIDLKNNIFLGNRGVAYSSGSPDTYDNNLYYDLTTSLTPPIWAELNINPLINESFEIGVANVGDNSAIAYTDVDFYGNSLVSGSILIGAITETSTVPAYDQPTITGPADSSTTSTSVEIEGPYTVDPDLADQSVVVTWTLGEASGFCVSALGVFSCTVPDLVLGSNSIVFEITDANGGTDSDTVIITRTVLKTTKAHGSATFKNTTLH